MTIENEKQFELSLEEHSDRGKFKFRLYFYKQALRHFYKTVKFDRFREDQYCIAVCFLRMKMFKELFEMFPEEKLEKNPIPNIWSTLGDAYDHLKNNAKRDYCYKQELKLLDKTHQKQDFESVATCTAYANLHAKLNNISVAEEFADLAVKMDPFSEDTWYAMGFVAKKKEDYVNALNYLIMAYKINCESTTVMVELSEVYEILGDIVRAYHYIERAYLWDPLWFIPRERALAMRTPDLFWNSRNFDQRSSLLF